ncbi:ABC transporter ATP-binding protein [uncultured Shewanella sp.]|uniref:ABC transporter ATP-binding protein n=1 Tax=uncultured Shewanella sp. TaxID=173975 RepID=UPI002619ADB0|nr:ABC transporter ATP-binding protein [uncultured Shewanella sp.]
MQTQVLQIENLQKSFGSGEQRHQVLNGVSFSVYEGEYIAICGPSGCGKSTLLNILSILDTADAGEYRIDGQNISDLNSEQRAQMRSRRIGIVFQSFNLIDELSIAENVALPLRYQGIKRNRRISRARECLDKVGLNDKAELYPNQLSGGQQQRVSIARALAADSGILLVDEPTGNLDSTNGDAVMALLSELNRQGTTICLVTHDPRYADQAQRKIHLLDGKVVQEKVVEAAA